MKKLDAFVNWINCKNEENKQLPKTKQKRYYTKRQGELKVLPGKKSTKR